MTIRQALLKVKDSSAWREFLVVHDEYKHREFEDLLQWEKEEFERAEMRLMLAMREIIIPILGRRLEHDKKYRKRNIYTINPQSRITKFLQVFKNQIKKNLPEFIGSFEKFEEHIKKGIYEASKGSSI